MIHRGPDDQGLHIEDGVGLGMRRLSIIDIAGGSQPMTNENNDIWTVCNGEIYNFMELKSELSAKGHIFRSRSDTEVILHGYEEYGSDFLRTLNGMFGLAIWDRAKQSLLLARDRLGIKPLYYYYDGVRFIFASELASILNSGFENLDLNFDYSALNQYYIYGHFPAPYTIFKRIRKLLPGTYLELHEHHIEERTYWEIDFDCSNSASEDELLEEYEVLLYRAVERHLNSDVEVGAFLSGGVDSATVVAVATDLTKNRFKTFSIGYAESTYDESVYAESMAHLLGCDHETKVLGTDVTGDDVIEIMGYFDEPFCDSSGIPTFYLSEFARRHVKTVLSGDGGDELCAGYNHYEELSRLYSSEYRTNSHRNLLCAPARSSLGCYKWLVRNSKSTTMENRYFVALGDRLSRLSYADWPLSLIALYSRISNPFRIFLQENAPTPAEEMSYFDFVAVGDVSENFIQVLNKFDFSNYLPNDILTKVDRMSMRHSLEVRVPLLDYTLVEFAARIPMKYKRAPGDSKYIMKKFLRKKFHQHPEACANIVRPKHGFRYPIGRLIDGPLKDRLRDSLANKDFQQDMGLSASGVEALTKARSNGRVGGKPIWMLFCLFIWWEQNLGR